MGKKNPKKRHSFQSKLKRIASGREYYAISVPAKITLALGTRGPVPVVARVNGSEIFMASLYPVGGGRHFLRIKNRICSAVKIKEGDRVRVQITVRDRSAEISIPNDLRKALRAEGVEAGFKALPIGKKSYLLRLIDEAVKPETRENKIQAAVEEAHQRRQREGKARTE
jgi:hypothetical protein